MTDLSLISFDELIQEARKRCNTFICAARFDCKDESNKELKFNYGQGKWVDAVGLAEILKNDVVNNWNNELETLQRINEERI